MEKPQSVFDWLRCWNPHENFHPGSTHPNLGFSWEVDDQKRDEEDEAGANIWRRRRFVTLWTKRSERERRKTAST